MSRKSVNRRRVGPIITGVLILTVAGCGGNASDSRADGPIRVGSSLPLTGTLSQPGKAAKEGYEVWQKMVNDAGGLLGRKVELVIKDDASNQNTIVSDYNALISKDKVDLLIGSYSSLLNLPASAVAERNKKLFVEPAGGSPEMFNRGFEYLFFTQQATADKSGLTLAKWMAALPEAERPKTAAYPTVDDPFAAPAVKTMKEVLEKAGVKTVYETSYPADTKNFDTIIARVKAAKPEVVINGSGFEDGVGIVRSLLKADFTPGWLYQIVAPSLGEQYAQAVGAENTEGVMFSISHAPQAKTPGNAEFVAAYRSMFGGLPPEDAADAFASGQVLQAAVEGVGGVDDQEALADWLRSNSVQTVLGDLSWNKDGSPRGEYLIGQWQNGKIEYILPNEIATSGHIVKGWKPGSKG
ncbi:amino acid ABC transporter substrate-binding protein [Streptomyces sp. NPDC005953]|uniref:amino acid ABC transporter substrate-binding protein n=2 Tax=Streptomyces TaxID=1883 RepID=UPI0033D47649